MSSMFEQYDNLSSQYIPSNMNKKPCITPQNPCLDPLVPKKPYENYNAEGELIGYWWSYGDTINLEFDLSGEVTTDDNYITVRDFIDNKQIQVSIYNFRHEQIYTQIFNGSDYQQFTYRYTPAVNKYTQGVYYTYSEGTYTPVQLPEDYEQGVKYYEQEDVSVILPIDTELSKSLGKGVYYCSVTIIDNNNLSYALINQGDFTLTVK